MTPLSLFRANYAFFRRFFPATLLQAAQILPAPWWVRVVMQIGGPHMIALTLGATIYFKPEIEKLPENKQIELIGHELKHVEQYEELGTVEFLRQYLREFWNVGYGGISFEKEAYAFQRKVREELESVG